MNFDRRSFLIGSSALLTIDFVQQVKTLVRRTGQPFLLPSTSTVECLYVNRWDDHIHLELWEPTKEELPCYPTAAPRWYEYLTKLGHELRTLDGVTTACDRWGITPAELREPVDEYTWQAVWDTTYCPSARAFRLLEDLDLGASDSGPKAGGLLFQESQYPGSNDRWVEAEDELTVSLLQARFNELRLPIQVRLGEGF